MGTERFNCVFSDYPEEIILAEKRLKKYIEQGKPLNKTQQKLLDEGAYVWAQKDKKKYCLYDTRTDEWVVKNPQTAGTQRTAPIGSQFLWKSGTGHEWTRMKMKDQIKAWFVPGIRRQLPERLTPGPGRYIQLEFIFYNNFEDKPLHQYQDWINHFYVRGKVFEDCLTELGIIPDDSPQYLRGGYARYVQTEPGEARRLEVKVHFCYNNERIH